ncbi:GerW family sporulation protein [Lachnospiraceae bacterium 66-29]
MQENNFNTTVQSLFKGMDSFITTKTVVGEAVHIGDTIILPLIEVSFGVGAGAFCQEKKNNAAGGLGGKVTPSAVLVIQNGCTKLVNIKNQDSITKILDMVPDFVNKFTNRNTSKEQPTTDESAKKEAAQELAEQLNVPSGEEQ